MPGEGLTHGPPAAKKAGGRHHRISQTSGIPCAMALTVYVVLSPGTGLSCPRRLVDHPAKLSASVGAPGPHDFAVHDELAFVFASLASTASHHTFVTLRNAPLIG